MLRTALRLMFDQPSKSLGTLLGVVISTFLMAQQLSTLLGILGRVAAFVDATNVDVWITSPTTLDADITLDVPMRYRSAAMGTEGVAWAAPIVQGMSRATRPDQVRELVKIVGVEGSRFLGLPASRSGKLGGPSRILINANDRPLYGWAVAGDRLELGGRSMIVSGFFDSVDPHGNYSYVFTQVEDARRILGVPPDRATFMAVAVAPDAAPDVVAARLRARIPEAKIFTRSQFRSEVVRHFMSRTPVGIVFGMGAVVAALVGSLIVGVTLFSSVVDRTRDFATLIAIGATRRRLRELLVYQSLLYFGAGASLGLGLFGVVVLHATSAPMLAPPWMLLAVATASLSCCLLASLVAVRRVFSIDPAIVFKG
jgi:putative ABC transport system permease protein